MKLIKKSILLFALAGGTFLSGGKAYAQQALVDVRVDSAAILIGEQEWRCWKFRKRTPP